MAIPTGWSLTFSFTAIFLAICTAVYAVVRKLSCVTSIGYVIVVIVTATLAIVNACNAQSHGPILDTVITCLISTIIAAGPLIKVETLYRQKLLSKLPHTQKYIAPAQIIASTRMIALSIVAISIFLGIIKLAILGSIILILVSLQYAFLSIIVHLLHRRAKKEARPFLIPIHKLLQSFQWMMASGCFTLSIIGFLSQNIELIGWTFWGVLHIGFLPESLLLAHTTIKIAVNGVLERGELSTDELTPSGGALVRSTDDSGELGNLGGSSAPENQVWWNAHTTDSQPLSPSDIGQNIHGSEEAALGLPSVNQLETILYRQSAESAESIGAERTRLEVTITTEVQITYEVQEPTRPRSSSVCQVLAFLTNLIQS